MESREVKKLAIEYLQELGTSTEYFYAINIRNFSGHALTLQGEVSRKALKYLSGLADLSVSEENGYIEGEFDYKGIKIAIVLTA